MPKSKNRRKTKAVSRKRHQLFLPKALRQNPSPSSAQTNAEPLAKATSNLSEKKSLRQRLFDNDAEGLAEVVSFLPVFLGAWLAAGLVLKEVSAFIAATTVILGVHYAEAVRQRQEIVFGDALRMLVWALSIAALFGLYAVTSHPWLCTLTAVCAAALLLEQKLAQHFSPRALVAQAFLRTARLMALGIIGVFSQIFRTEAGLIWEYGVLGIVPGTVLSASLFCRYARQLSAAGWQRSRKSTKKDGSEVLRPGILAQYFALFLVIGPAVPIALSPLGIFPSSFLGLALAFLIIPRIAENFLHQRVPDGVITQGVVKLSAMLCLLIFVLGFISRYTT